MTRYRVEKIRKRDGRGRLLAAGVKWTELNPGYEIVGVVIAMFGVAALIFAVVLGSIPAVSGLLTATGLALLLGGLALAYLTPPKWRSLTFGADGSMSMPQGIPGFWSAKVIDGHYDDIMSIEQRHAGQGWTVRVISRGGDIIRISANMVEWTSLKTAVQLTQALEELRNEAKGDAGRGREPDEKLLID